MSNIVYSIEQKPPLGKTLLGAFQQILSVLAATIAVPAAVTAAVAQKGIVLGDGMSQSAALFGAGIGTIAYLLITRFKSPVFLGSSFAFIGPMIAAFTGAVSVSVGYLGIVIGAILAGLVYVILSILVRIFGSSWVDKVMPPVVIGPTVALIGLSLAPAAVGDITSANVINPDTLTQLAHPLIALSVGLITLFSTILFSVYGKKLMKMIPFILGIGCGYAFAALLTLIGHLSKTDALMIIDFSIFNNMKWIPDFTFIHAFESFKEIPSTGEFFKYLGIIAAAYIPVAFVSFSEHIADHKNLSSIVEINLLENPGLHQTVLGDGVGTAIGAFFGGCPNTTYGESIACTAISGNASIRVIFTASIMAILMAFIGPIITFFATVPKCVMGGVCLILYGFIAVSGLKMLKNVDLGDHRNLFVVSVILIAGVGGLVLNIVGVEITAIAFALILGIITNLLVNIKRKNKEENNIEEKEE